MSSSCLTAIAKTLNIDLNKKRECGHPCHNPNFKGNALNLSPSNIMLTTGLLSIAFFSTFKDISSFRLLNQYCDIMMFLLECMEGT